MAIFREYVRSGKDRSAEDRRRHRQLVEDSIKKNLGEIVAEESIIAQGKNKKIKIPIKSIKEYRFIYGKNINGTGTGSGSEKRGDTIGDDKDGQGMGKGGPGDQEGEDIYETEITIEDLIKYLYDDLNLPDIDKKKLKEVESEFSRRLKGYQLKGIPPRLSKKRSVIEKIKRKQGWLREVEEREDDVSSEDTRFPFMEDDLRYRRVKETRKKDYNAVVICIMDVSGSMDQIKKFMARSFYFLLYQFIRIKYSNVNVAFIAHTTTAKEVSEKEFFHRGESGGTYISSGYDKALEIIEQRYNPANWNIYAFHCSDGDNWPEDNEKALNSGRRLCGVCNLFGYGEIANRYFSAGTTMADIFEREIELDNYSVVRMKTKEDIYPGLKKLLSKEGA